MREGESLARQVADKLGREVADGALKPGSVIRTEELQAHFDVSRTVVREAVRTLEAKRMLRSTPHVGLTVRPVADWHLYDPDVIRWRLSGPGRIAHLDELTELRAAIEPAAAAAAARREDAPGAEALLLCAATMRARAAVGDRAGFLEADVRFHRTLLTMCGNLLFAQLGPVTEELLRGRAEMRLLPAAPDPGDAARHDAVAIAIAARRADEAESAMRLVVRESLEDIHRRLGEP
jgi:DNA-binding FadR family transcriptional regulator